MRVERGFTLIEILVIIVIVGITLGFALLAFGDFGASRSTRMAAEQLKAYILLLQQRAMLENDTFGIKLERDGYATYRWQEGHWQMLPKTARFHWFALPKNTALDVKDTNSPQIVLSPSGSMSLFRVFFRTSGNDDNAWILSGQPNGALSLGQNHGS